jgi:hypothetical protein
VNADLVTLQFRKSTRLTEGVSIVVNDGDFHGVPLGGLQRAASLAMAPKAVNALAVTAGRRGATCCAK